MPIMIQTTAIIMFASESLRGAIEKWQINLNMYCQELLHFALVSKQHWSYFNNGERQQKCSYHWYTPKVMTPLLKWWLKSFAHKLQIHLLLIISYFLFSGICSRASNIPLDGSSYPYIIYKTDDTDCIIKKSFSSSF